MDINTYKVLNFNDKIEGVEVSISNQNLVFSDEEHRNAFQNALGSLSEAEFLDLVKKYFLNEGKNFADRKRVEVPKSVMEGAEVTKEVYAFWQKQEGKARRISSNIGTEEDLNSLSKQVIRRNRGETVQDLVEKILNKVTLFDELGSIIDNGLTVIEDNVLSCTTPEQVAQSFATAKQAVETEIITYLGSLT